MSEAPLYFVQKLARAFVPVSCVAVSVPAGRYCTATEVPAAPSGRACLAVSVDRPPA